VITDYLSSLNERQRSAAEHGDDKVAAPLLIIAISTATWSWNWPTLNSRAPDRLR
jgi:hypothetical protein